MVIISHVFEYYIYCVVFHKLVYALLPLCYLLCVCCFTYFISFISICLSLFSSTYLVTHCLIYMHGYIIGHLINLFEIPTLINLITYRIIHKSFKVSFVPQYITRTINPNIVIGVYIEFEKT